MRKLSLEKRAARTAIAVLAAGLAVTAPLCVTSRYVAGTAHADPIQLTNPLVGIGSNTTQSVDDAFAGFVNGTNYGALQANPGPYQLTSWDATGSVCITPRAPGTTFTRPNGSVDGVTALSRAIDGTGWGVTGDACGGPKSVAGLIDYGRSSNAPGAFTYQTDALTFIPFGRDAVSYAYSVHGSAAAVTVFTKAELQSIYAGTGDGTTIRGTLVIPCGIQAGSGTESFWEAAIGVTAAQEDTATTLCNKAGTGARIEENTGTSLVAKSNALAVQSAPPNGGNFEVIVAHSAASFIAQHNGKAPNMLGNPPVGLGAISNNGSGTNLGFPCDNSVPTDSCAGTSLTPDAAFYNDATFGRYVYHVLDSARVQTGTLGNTALKAMFVGTGSAVCSAASQATNNLFGFRSLTGGAAWNTCGDISRQQDLECAASCPAPVPPVTVFMGSNSYGVQAVPAGGGQLPAGGAHPNPESIGGCDCYPYGLSPDSHGDLFVAAQLQDQVVEIFPNSASVVVGSGLAAPTGVAVDGHDNLFISDTGNSRIVELPAGGGAQVTFASGLSNPAALAVDPTGDVVVQVSTRQLMEFPAGGGAGHTVTAAGTPDGFAFDEDGNLFLTYAARNEIDELPPSGTATRIVLTGKGLNQPGPLALDAAGDMFVSNGGPVVEFPAGGGQPTRIDQVSGENVGPLATSPLPPPMPIAPAVANVSPNQGPTAGGTTVKIRGSDFWGAYGVYFGNTPAKSFTVDSGSQITAVSPASAAGTVDISIVSVGLRNAPTAADRFTFGP